MKFARLDKIRLVFLLLGILILILLFKNFGVMKFINDLKLLGWRFIIIVALFLFNNVFLTYSWKILINHAVKWKKFYKLVLARIAGDSTSSINAIGSLAGEPIKAMFIRDIVPFKTGLASVVLDRTIRTLVNVLIIMMGIIFSFFFLEIPAGISIGFLLIIIITVFILLMILRKQRDGFIEYLVKKIPARISSKFMTEERLKKIKEIDGEIAFILSGKNNLRRFYISLAIDYISILATGTLEVFFILLFINNNITIINSMFVYIFSLFITSVVFFMPANIGTSEASYSLALKFLGFDPALGLTVGIIRRLRTFVWAGIGMLILFYGGMKKEKNNSCSG